MEVINAYYSSKADGQSAVCGTIGEDVRDDVIEMEQ